MQTSEQQLKRQQEILKALGFYSGAVDGVWGPISIKAMQNFESDPEFVPGIPNNGMPFRERPPYPRGITLQDGILYHAALDKVDDVPTYVPKKLEKKD